MEPKEWLKQHDLSVLDQLIRQAQEQEKKMLESLTQKEVFDYMISKLNFCQRKRAYSYKEVLSGCRVRVGDICFIDFGQAYIMEIGYLHFGLILAFKHNKAFVVPMTGKISRQPKDHLYSLGNVPGLNKESCLFLNDAKWINTARIIDIKGHLDPSGKQFCRIKKSVIECIGAGNKE
ncbi:hypothetical protein [uncultured Faecalicoccus sp.]|uniref:hypothetical protein n=1 Tax=uncultured Faecalicoccus sp. TaxID=1971760 RepID=UPI0026379384|nr:hypothetical protein [uncultured Faecalicoccus sp.]